VEREVLSLTYRRAVMDREQCSTDGCTKLRVSRGKNAQGVTQYKKHCTRHSMPPEKYAEWQKARTAAKMRKDPDIYKKVQATYAPNLAYRQYRKDYCEHCGLVPEYECVLDVDHINMDHSDNRPENLQTLCANCHRIKTYKERNGLQ
jgi:hypothetical protein